MFDSMGYYHLSIWNGTHKFHHHLNYLHLLTLTLVEDIAWVKDVGEVSAVSWVWKEIEDGVKGQIEDDISFDDYSSLDLHLEGGELSFGFEGPVTAGLECLYVCHEEVGGILNKEILLGEEESWFRLILGENLHLFFKF